jgi:hypothetical protein
VWLDEDEVRPGDSIIEKMDSGLLDADVLVLCYSSIGVSSPWTSREWMSALARQLESAGIRVIPVRLAGGAAPAILADIRYADLSTDWNRGLTDLLRAL